MTTFARYRGRACYCFKCKHFTSGKELGDRCSQHKDHRNATWLFTSYGAKGGPFLGPRAIKVALLLLTADCMWQPLCCKLATHGDFSQLVAL